MTSTKYICEICKSVFKTRYNAKRHMRAVHLRIVHSSCSICERKFNRKDSLTKHLAKVHFIENSSSSGEPGLVNPEGDSISNEESSDLQYDNSIHLSNSREPGLVNPEGDSASDEESSDLQHDNSNILCDESSVNCDDISNSASSKSTWIEPGIKEPFILHLEEVTSNESSAMELLHGGKSDTVTTESTALEQNESFALDNEDESSFSCDNTTISTIPLGQAESNTDENNVICLPLGQAESNTDENNVICLIPENVDDKLTCQYCFKKFKRSDHTIRHVRKVHKMEPPMAVFLECPDCKARFKSTSRLEEHLNKVHKKNLDGSELAPKKKPFVKEPNGTYIKCIECSTNYKNLQLLRDHLSAVHHLNMEKQELHFPNMAAFKKWKHDLERRELSSYILRHGFRKTKKGRKNEYCCHRSGKNECIMDGQRKRMLKTSGTVKLGIICTSVMVCLERPTGVIVKFYPHHYGHGKELSFMHLSPEEQDAIQDNVSKGIPFENLLGDIKDNQSSADHFQLYLIKKKDARFITNAYAADDYNPGMGEVESVDRWVRQCWEMENSPILFYRPEGAGKSKESFLLIIMTEFQKQILMSASKQVVCVDTLDRKKGGGFYFSVLMVMDDNDIAFPVAFCLSKKVDKACMIQFFRSIQESTGPLSFAYFMSNNEEFIYEAWKEVMDDEIAKWLWCMWFVENRIRMKLKVFKGNVIKKAEAYKTMRTLFECQNVNVFESMFKSYIEMLKFDPNSRALGEYINERYGKQAHMWAYCHRKDIPLSTNIHLEVLHRTFHFCCREGRKKRLDKFLFVVMKLVKYKMLDRLSNMLDEEKIEMAIEAINICHNEGLEVTSERILSLSDKTWLIQGEEDGQNIYVMREFDACPEHCSLRCRECDICVHMYTCSCIHSVINANMCPHIHAVVYKFLTPHFSAPPSPILNDIEEQENMDVSVIPDECSELLDEILSKSHDVYKIVREHKCILTKESLTAILKRLNECIAIGRGKDVAEFMVNNAQNVLSVVLPNNCQDLSQYVFVLPNDETSTPTVPINVAS